MFFEELIQKAEPGLTPRKANRLQPQTTPVGEKGLKKSLPKTPGVKKNPKPKKELPSGLDKTLFNHFMRSHKPFLNPDLTIADVVKALESNRTYVSEFVNKAYNMNFSSYINLCRLREMNRLLALPKNSGLTPAELIPQTGFGTMRNYLRTKRQFIAVAAYASSGLGLASIVFYIAMPSVYAALGIPVMGCFVIVNVLYYRFIFELTKTRAEEHFSGRHYFAPALITLAYLVWSLFVPFDVQCRIVALKCGVVVGYEFYSWFSASKPFLFSVFMSVYGLMSIRRIKRFRRVVVNYSADEQRTSLTWLYQIAYIMLGMTPLVLMFILLSNRVLTLTLVVVIPLLFFILRDVTLVHNILTDNFVIITPDANDNLPLQTGSKPLFAQTRHEDKLRLENYMRQEKPYLNPELKITDIATGLNTNRTSLSLLINRSYGMNFSRFVNRYRLEELEEIRVRPDNNNLPLIELIAKAGFSEWRGYLRVKQREESYFK